MAEITTIHQGGAEIGAAKTVIIMLHGLGADGRDLLNLAPYWAVKPQEVAFVAPDAPFPCDMAPMGYQWFSLQDRDPHVLLNGVEEAAPILGAFIEDVMAEYQLGPEQVIVMGFSQGAMMALYTATRWVEQKTGKTLGGIMAYSGALAGEAGPQKLPVLLVHGTQDEVVPFAAHQVALDALQDAGFKVDAHAINGLSHGIDEEAIKAGQAFLEKIIR